MRILVTGAAGFIGYHLVKLLAEADDNFIVGIDNINDYYDVNLKYDRLNDIGFPRESIGVSAIESNKRDNLYFKKLDLADLTSLNHLFQQYRFDVVVNLAAQAGVRYSLRNPHSYVQSNLVGFVNILECCRHNEIKHLVYASSSSVYGMNEKTPFSEDDNVDHPVSLYAATKKSNELLAHAYSHLYALPTTGLRFFTVYGPWGRPDMSPMLFANAIFNGKPIKVFNNGDMERDFTYIDDITKGIAGVIGAAPDGRDMPPFYRILNIGNSSPVKLMDFIATLEGAIGKEAPKKMYPMQPGDVTRTYADVTKLGELTGYSPGTTIGEGVKSFVKWYKNYFE